MLDLTACPEPGCMSPAEIIERFAMGSTGGPMEHVRTRCLYKHHFFMPVEKLASPHVVDREEVTADILRWPPGDD
jgi:hypothetical protein